MKTLHAVSAIGGLIIAGASLAPAQPATPALLDIEAAVFRIDFNESRPFGSEVTTPQIRAAILADGISALGPLLDPEGDVALVRRGDTTTTLDDSTARFFIGSEQPFVTTTSDPAAGTRTVNQSTVTSGMNAEFEVTRDDPNGRALAFSVDFDQATPRTVDGTTLIGRNRFNWDGSLPFNEDNVVIVNRATSDEGDGPAEFIFVARVAAGMAEPSNR